MTPLLSLLRLRLPFQLFAIDSPRWSRRSTTWLGSFQLFAIDSILVYIWYSLSIMLDFQLFAIDSRAVVELPSYGLPGLSTLCYRFEKRLEYKQALLEALFQLFAIDSHGMYSTSVYWSSIVFQLFAIDSTGCPFSLWTLRLSSSFQLFAIDSPFKT